MSTNSTIGVHSSADDRQISLELGPMTGGEIILDEATGLFEISFAFRGGDIILRGAAARDFAREYLTGPNPATQPLPLRRINSPT